MLRVLVRLVRRATPLLVVGGALAVLLVYRQQLELDKPLSLLILSWLRNAVGFGRDAMFFWMAGLLFLVAEYRWPARQVDRRANLHWDLASYRDRLFGSLRSPDAVGAVHRVGLTGRPAAKIRMMLGV